MVVSVSYIIIVKDVNAINLGPFFMYLYGISILFDVTKRLLKVANYFWKSYINNTHKIDIVSNCFAKYLTQKVIRTSQQ
jgi:hypothetical protein